MAIGRGRNGLAQAKNSEGGKFGNLVILPGGQIPGSGDTAKARLEKSKKSDDYALKIMKIIDDITGIENLPLKK